MDKDFVVVQWIAPDGLYHALLIDNNAVDWKSVDLHAVAVAAGSGETLHEALEQLQVHAGQEVHVHGLRAVHRDGTEFGELAKIISPDMEE